MQSKKIIRILSILIILSANIGCDQLSKSIVRQRMDYYERISLLNNHLIITKVENTGAFLNFGNKLPGYIKMTLLVLIPSLLILFGIVYIFIRTNLSKYKMIGLTCIIGGGIGNIYDRLLYNSVTDFLHFDFVIFKTGILNMADLSISFGMVILIFESFFSRKKLEYQSPSEE